MPIYVDLIVTGGDAAQHSPGVAAQRVACGPCAEDLVGLLAAVTGG